MSLSYDQLEAFLAQNGASVDASDLHGSVTGYLCGGGQAGQRELLDALELDMDEGEPRRRMESRLKELMRECRAELEDAQLGFHPLLPDAARPVSERADALVEWCRGFLGGFGLAGVDKSSDLTGEGDEILRDLGSIAASELDCGDGEEDERSLVEVSEFVRVGALILHAEVAGRRAAPSAPGSVH